MLGVVPTEELLAMRARVLNRTEAGREVRSIFQRLPERLRLNNWALGGEWTIKPEAAALKGATGRIVYRFHARDVNLIMGASPRGTPVGFRVRINGKPPGDAHGSDVDEQGYGLVTEPRMYQLIRQPGPIADRVFDIEFVGPGVEAFDFTFG
jgi:hypothetical protein